MVDQALQEEPRTLKSFDPVSFLLVPMKHFEDLRLVDIFRAPSRTLTNAHAAAFQTVANDRSQYYRDLTLPFFGYNRPGAKISEGIRENFWFQGMQGGIKGHLDCIKAFSETDFTEDLRKIDVPTLVMHGDDDQIVPFADTGALTARIVRKATLKVYPGFPHGMPISHADVINPDLSAFIKS